MSKSKNAESRNIAARLLFVLYVVLMIWLLFGQRLRGGVSATDNLNVTPFETLKIYAGILQNSGNRGLLRHALVNLIGNVVMFIPLGYYLTVIWRRQRNFFVCLMTGTVLISLIESTQYFTKLGSCDVDDLILNLPGIMLGYLIGLLRVRNRH